MGIGRRIKKMMKRQRKCRRSLRRKGGKGEEVHMKRRVIRR